MYVLYILFEEHVEPAHKIMALFVLRNSSSAHAQPAIQWG